jgi:hypothetical protein
LLESLEWRQIYEHCGGNIWLLRKSVKNARGEENWDATLERAVAGALSAVNSAAKPGQLPVRDTRPLWNGAQWKRVLELINKAPYHAVLKSQLEKELGKDNETSGELILLSMVNTLCWRCATLLTLRVICLRRCMGTV